MSRSAYRQGRVSFRLGDLLWKKKYMSIVTRLLSASVILGAVYIIIVVGIYSLLLLPIESMDLLNRQVH